jgi:tricorn protease
MAPGLNVTEGDAILAVNGRALDATVNIYSLLEGTAGKQVSLTVSRDGTAKSARTVTWIPWR